jgi:hypothetical protein
MTSQNLVLADAMAPLGRLPSGSLAVTQAPREVGQTRASGGKLGERIIGISRFFASSGGFL